MGEYVKFYIFFFKGEKKYCLTVLGLKTISVISFWMFSLFRVFFVPCSFPLVAYEFTRSTSARHRVG